MNIKQQIKDYIASLPELKRLDMETAIQDVVDATNKKQSNYI